MASPDLLQRAAVGRTRKPLNTGGNEERGHFGIDENSIGVRVPLPKLCYECAQRIESRADGGGLQLYDTWMEKQTDDKRTDPLFTVRCSECNKPLSASETYTEMQDTSSRNRVETDDQNENFNGLEPPVRDIGRLESTFSTAPLNLGPALADASSGASLTEGDEEDDDSDDYAISTEEGTKKDVTMDFDNNNNDNNDKDDDNYNSEMESDTTPKPAKRNVRIDDILEATLEHDGFSTGTESDAPNSPRSGSIKFRDFSNSLYDRGLALGANSMTSYTDEWLDSTQNLQQLQQQQRQRQSEQQQLQLGQALAYEPKKLDLNWEATNSGMKLGDNTISPTTTLERTKETGLALSVPILGTHTPTNHASTSMDIITRNDGVLFPKDNAQTMEGANQFISPLKHDLARHASLENRTPEDRSVQDSKTNGGTAPTPTSAYKKLGRRLSMKSRSLFRSRKNKDNVDVEKPAASGANPSQDSRKSSPSPDTHTGWGTKTPANNLTVTRSSHSRNSHTGRSDTLLYKQHRQQSSTASDTSTSSLFKNIGLWGSRDGLTNDSGTTQASNNRSSPNPPMTHRRTRSSFIAPTFHGAPAIQPLASVPLGTTAQISVPEFERQNSNVTVSMFRTPPLENNMVFNRMSSPSKSDNKMSLTLSTSPQLHSLNKPRLHDIGLLHSRTIEHNRSLSWNTHLDSPISEVPADFPFFDSKIMNKTESEPSTETKRSHQDSAEKDVRKTEAKLRNVKTELRTLQETKQQLYLDIEKLQEYKRSLLREIELLKSTRDNLAEDFTISRHDRSMRNSFDGLRPDVDTHINNTSAIAPSSSPQTHSLANRSKFWKFFGKEQHNNLKELPITTIDQAVGSNSTDIGTPTTFANAMNAAVTVTPNETPQTMITSSGGGGGSGSGSTGTNTGTKHLSPALHNKIFTPMNQSSSKSHSAGSSPSSSLPSVVQIQSNASPALGRTTESEAHNVQYYKPTFDESKISLIRQCQLENREVPVIVTKCIEYIEASPRGLKTEGIYRKAGSHTQIENLERILQRAGDSDSGTFDIKNAIGDNVVEAFQGSDIDINVVASVLKRYLRRFEEPVISYNVYDDLILIVRQYSLLSRGSVADIKSQENAELFGIVKEKIRRTLAMGMPREHMSLLKVLIAHVNEVAKWKDWNLMNLHNLSLVFVPSLIRDRNGEKDIADMKERNYLVEFIFTYGVA